MQGRSAAMY